jgi:hypothetical protein
MSRKAATRLERFLREWNIKPSVLAREINISRKHLCDIRAGRVEPSRVSIATIVSGVRKLVGAPIPVESLFDLYDVRRRRAS